MSEETMRPLSRLEEKSQRVEDLERALCDLVVAARKCAADLESMSGPLTAALSPIIEALDAAARKGDREL